MATYAELVGRRFKAHDGGVYECDAYDPSCGLWMTWVEGKMPAKSDLRRNVSERAVGRTFHLIEDI